MKKFRIAETAVCFLLIATIFALAVFSAVPALTRKTAESQSRVGVVRLWNIDTFEGGKGSRTSFLSRVATRYEKKHKGVYVMVSSYTQEGAKAAFAKGEYPEMISFGLGSAPDAEKCLKISPSRLTFTGGNPPSSLLSSFNGGAVGGEIRALPWCRGGYALFCLEDNFSDAYAGNTLVSVGGNNLPLIAAALYEKNAQKQGETQSETVSGTDSKQLKTADSTAAYVDFLSGKYKYLLGTQRDVCRFLTRGVNVYAQPLQAFCDLYQYIAVTARTEDEKKICEDFLGCLLGEENQKKLSEIGMMSAFFDVYGADNPLANELESVFASYTLGVFTSGEGLKNAANAAQTALFAGAGIGVGGAGNDLENSDRDKKVRELKNFLKTVPNTFKK